jgi:hypothetical protein
LRAKIVTAATSEVLDIEPVHRHFRRAPESAWTAQADSDLIGPSKGLRFERWRAGNADIVHDNLEPAIDGHGTHGHAVSGRLL